MPSRKKTCFVIMPYRKKRGIDFDKVYNDIIEPAIIDLGINCVRSDRIERGGRIHRDMFTHIVDDEVAVVDVSTLNPNVMYELGVRHATRRSVTVMIGEEGIEMPFNIVGYRTIEYDPKDESCYEDVQESIKRFIRNGLAGGEHTDSPVFDDLKDLTVERGYSPPIEYSEIYRYKLKDTLGKSIGIVTGDIRRAKRVAGIWVNPENVYMQMARPWDRAISAVIRYMGAKKTRGGSIEEDVIADELKQIMVRENARQVDEGIVIPTNSGELKSSHGVSKIFHVASARAKVGGGYSPVDDLGQCVTNALSLADSPEFSGEDYRSILFPLLATGTSRGDLNEKFPILLNAAIKYLSTRNSNIEHVYFLTLTEVEFLVCRTILEHSESIVANSVIQEAIDN